MPPLLHVEHLSFCHDGVTALADICFQMQAGERVALVGANGSGKSTLLLLLAGCLAPAGGSVILRGEDCANTPRAAAKHLGLLFQNQDCQLIMPSVREELLLALGHTSHDNCPALPEVEDYAARHGLTPLLDRAPHRLSAGQRQKVALATLCITRPALLLLDEPTAALDPQARQTLGHMLDEAPEALLMATHDLDFAARTCQRVLLLDQGQLVADGPVGSLLADAKFLRAHHLDLPLCLQELPKIFC